MCVTHLYGQDNEGHTDHDDHKQLGRPDLWGDIAEAHGGEGDHTEVERVKQRQVVPRTLQVLDPTDTEN